MSIAGNTTISVTRLTHDGARKGDYTGLPHLRAIPCCIQQLSEAPEEAFGNAAAYKYYQALDLGQVVDIREGDQVTDADGNTYIVKGVRSWHEPEIGGEMEIVLAKKAL